MAINRVKSAILSLFFASSLAQGAALPDLWPLTLKAPQPSELNERCAALAVQTPPELKPALQFQQIFLKIIASGASKAQPLEPDWVAPLRGLVAADRPEDAMGHGVAEVARAWLARVGMLKIDAGLHQFYRHHVRFPDRFSEIEPALPEGLRRDPWGRPWVYKTGAPQGLAKLSDQRYQIGPALFPNLGSFKDAVGDRNPLPQKWTLLPVRIGDRPALEFRIPNGSTATVQPGGKVDSFTLLFIGDTWALMAGPDQLFALRFSN